MDKSHVLLSKSRKKCRLCLGKPTVAFPLTEDIILMVESITSIKLINDDPRFDVICCKCNLDLQLINKILEKFRTADTKLKEMIEQGDLVEIKEETSNVDEQEYKYSIDPFMMETSASVTKEEVMNEEEDEEEEDDAVVVDDQEMSITTSERFLNSEGVHSAADHQKYEIIEKWLQRRKKKRTCPICGKEFEDTEKYSSHVYNHQRINCELCNINISRSNYAKHLQIVHSDHSPVICEICGAVAKNSESLRAHIYVYHSKPKSHCCEYCGKKFTKKSILNSHVDRVHLKVANQNICEKCGKSFYAKYKLTLHVKKIHENYKPYQCQYCKKRFNTKCSMKTHERQHTNETPYRCELCGEGFRQNISLRSHKKSKHNIVEELIVSCEICPKKFPTEWALNTHVKKMHPS